MQLIRGGLDDVLKAKLSAALVGSGQGQADLIEADSPNLPVPLFDHERQGIVDAEDEGFAQLIDHLIEGSICGIDAGSAYELLLEMIIDQHRIGMATAGDAAHSAPNGPLAEIGCDAFPDEQGRFLGIEARLSQPIDEVVFLEVAANEGSSVVGVSIQSTEELELEALTGRVIYLEPAQSIPPHASGSGIEPGTEQHDLGAFTRRLTKPADALVDPSSAQGDPQLRCGVDLVMSIGEGHSDISGELGSPRIATEGLRTSCRPGAKGGDEHGGATG